MSTRTSFYYAPLFEMSDNRLLRVRPSPCLFDPPNVQSPILPVETTDTAHVVAVVGKLVPCEAILGAVWQGQQGIGKEMEIFTFPAIWTTTACEEDAGVLDSGCVGPSEACVAFYVASGL
jgi:hypothetical protein